MTDVIAGGPTAEPSGGDAPVEHLDVVIVGAGISGIGSAYHLSTQLPHKRFAVLEALDGYGGKWNGHP